MTTHSEGNEAVTLTGIVTPVDWDKRNVITALAICTADESEYIVEPPEMLAKLLPYVHDLIEVSGTVRETEFGELIVNVDSFEVCENTGGVDPWRSRQETPYLVGDEDLDGFSADETDEPLGDENLEDEDL